MQAQLFFHFLLVGDCLVGDNKGANHWLGQRISAVILYALFIWLLLSLDQLKQSQMIHWLSQPINASLLWGLINISLYHSFLGFSSIITDYCNNHKYYKIYLWVVSIVMIFASIFSLFCFIKIFSLT